VRKQILESISRGLCCCTITLRQRALDPLTKNEALFELHQPGKGASLRAKLLCTSSHLYLTVNDKHLWRSQRSACCRFARSPSSTKSIRTRVTHATLELMPSACNSAVMRDSVVEDNERVCVGPRRIKLQRLGIVGLAKRSNPRVITFVPAMVKAASHGGNVMA